MHAQLHDNTGSYEPDMAAEIDTPEEIIADELGVNLVTARKVVALIHKENQRSEALVLGQVLGLLIASNNLPVMVHALALAAGLDQINGAHSETEVAKKLGVTKSLLSHYVVGWRDLLSGREYSFDVLKFRKKNSTRAIYAEKAKSPFIEAKNRAISKVLAAR